MKATESNRGGKKPVIVFVGAGSRNFGPALCAKICESPALRGSQLRLVDLNANALKDAERLAVMMSGKRGANLRISSHTSLSGALPGADFVLISVAIDRINRWETDLKLSAKYGLTEPQGECGGPGGLSLTLRNVPMILRIAREVKRYSPSAVILNLCNPVPRICLAITRYTGVLAVGLCHGIFMRQHHLSKLLKRDVAVQGFGLNHFNWIYDIKWADTGKDAWKEAALAFLKGKSDPYSQELLDIFGRIVAPGGHHVTEFVHHWRGGEGGLNPRYYFSRKDMDRYRRKAVEDREKMGKCLLGQIDPFSKEGFMTFSGEGAVPFMSSFIGRSPRYRETAVNIPNRGCISNLPDGAIVEVPAVVSRGKIVGCKMGELPKGIRSLCARQIDIAELSVEAAVEGDRRKALQALAIDPIVTDLDMARRYLDDVLKAHKDVLPAFK
ncbi:MAG: hypothetical protein HZA50_12680 [Planctomycetes bacterium]|nr:hypothetical protein [Planctomycetota bacterium]